MYHFSSSRRKEEQNRTNTRTQATKNSVRLLRSLLSYEDHVTSAERLQFRIIIFSLQHKEVSRCHTKKPRTLTDTGTVIKKKRPKR